MPTMPTSKTVSRSSPSQSVRYNLNGAHSPYHISNTCLELELDEEGTRISLTIVDTPGFGDQIDNEARYEPTQKQHKALWSQKLTLASFSEIVGYLERQYDDILAEESRIKRNPRFRDNRVHAMLYFITPTGHGYVYCLSQRPHSF